MRVVQGTVVKATATLTDLDTGLPYDPPGVSLLIETPTGAKTTQTLAGGQLVRLATGRYRGLIDTSPAVGDWQLEFSSTGTTTNTRRQGTFTVVLSLAT